MMFSMTNNNFPSRETVLNIIEAYEGMLRVDWNNNGAKERRAYWVMVLRGMK